MNMFKSSLTKPGSFWDTLIEVWKERGKLGDKNIPRDELAFLPAALEIQETPPHPLAKWVGRSLIILFAIIILWACLGHVNIVATAEGKIIPSSRLKQIQPLEKGVVKNILVNEGQTVRKGQPLIELDRTLTAADQQRLSYELKQIRLNEARMQQFQKWLQQSVEQGRGQDEGQGENLSQDKIQSETPAQINDAESSQWLAGIDNVSALDQLLQQQLLEQQWQQYQAQRGTAESTLQSRLAEKQTSLEVIKRLESTLPLITKRTDAMKGLLEKNMVSEVQYMELEEQRITQQQDLAAQHANQLRLDAAIEEARQRLLALNAQVQSETLQQIAELQRQIKAITEELNKASDLHDKQILYSPVDGQVQGLVTNTIGGVVMEAQQLMTIVPEGENLEVEVFLENKDIGFVHEGDKAEIKIHTFPFTKYGVIDATVTRISEDAFSMDSSAQGQKQAQSPNAGLVYTMSLLMEKSTIRVNGEEVRLLPGMAVTAEVKTGERRMIEFFLAPLMKARMESIRER